MSVLEYISNGTGPNGSDEIKQVSDVDPLPSSAQINGNVTQNISATSANSLTEDYDAVADSAGNYTTGDRLRKVVIYELDTDGGTRTHWYNVTTNVKLAAAPAVNDVSLVTQTQSVGAQIDYFEVTQTHTCVADAGTTFTAGDILRRTATSDSDGNTIESWAKVTGDGNVTTSYGVGLFPRINQIRPYAFDASTRPLSVEVTNSTLSAIPSRVVDEVFSSAQSGYPTSATAPSEISMAGAIVEGLYVKNQDTAAKCYVFFGNTAYYALASDALKIAFIKEHGIELLPGKEWVLPFKMDCTGAVQSLVFCSDIAQVVANSLNIVYTLRGAVR